jgi:hypothetical protein
MTDLNLLSEMPQRNPLEKQMVAKEDVRLGAGTWSLSWAGGRRLTELRGSRKEDL